MSKKQRKRHAHDKPKHPKPETLSREAAQALAAEHWRDAVTALKALAKQTEAPEQQAEVRRDLARAYAGRARELAAKGMHKEALAIWENRAALGDDVPPTVEQVTAMLETGGAARALTLYVKGASALPAAERDRLRATFAARVLGGDRSLSAKITEDLPADDPIVAHLPSAQAALNAYCAADEDALSAALKELPFRSPYRDWALVLKALSRICDDTAAAETRTREEVHALLQRIGDDSPFAPLRQAAESALLPEPAFLAFIRDAGRNGATVAATLRGWSADQLQRARTLTAELAQLEANRSDPRAMLKLLHRHAPLLGAGWVRRASLRVLAPHWPKSRTWLKGAGGKPTTEAEQLLLDAWEVEHGNRNWELASAWQDYADVLIDELGSRRGAVAGSAAPRAAGASRGRGRHKAAARATTEPADAELRIALALRRFEAEAHALDEVDPWHDPDSPDHTAADQLEQSLRYDPGHRDTYMRLVDYYQRADRRKEATHLLDAALKRWPTDLKVLGAALDRALDNNAFKKAAGLAQKILKVDPINTDVRRRLILAHVRHASKNAPLRPDLARREIAEAKRWTARGDDVTAEHLRLLEAMLSYNEDSGNALPEIREALGERGDRFDGQIALALASASAGVAIDRLLGELGMETAHPTEGKELFAGLKRLKAHLDAHETYPTYAARWVADVLKKAPWRRLDATELEQSCEILRRMNLQQLRRDAAQAGEKLKGKPPIFVFHHAEARYQETNALRQEDVKRLEGALDRARAGGDTGTAQRILGLLSDAAPSGGFPPFGMPSPFGGAFPFPEDDWADDEELDPFFDEPESRALDNLMDLIGNLPQGDLTGDGPGAPSRKPETQAIRALLASMPLREALNLFQVPDPLRQDLLDTARRDGNQAAIDRLVHFIEMAASFAGLEPQFGALEDPQFGDPSGRREPIDDGPRGRPKRGKKKGAGRAKTDSAQNQTSSDRTDGGDSEDGGSGQLDLF